MPKRGSRCGSWPWPVRAAPPITSGVGAAREVLASADFFGAVFGLSDDDQEQLHRQAAAILRAEVLSWRNTPHRPA